MTPTILVEHSVRDWRTDPGTLCVQCREPRGGIYRERLSCVIADSAGGVLHEFGRHRFRPHTAEERDAINRDEAASNENH